MNNRTRYLLRSLRILFPAAIFCWFYLGFIYHSQSVEPGKLSVEIVEAATGDPTPVRVYLRDSSGRAAPLPEEAIRVMYGRDDQAEGYGYQPDSAFYVDGSFTLDLGPGTYQLRLTKGFEYRSHIDSIQISSGGATGKTYRMQRWINMPERGWYSADDHIHIRRSPRENPHILRWIAAEDVHVGTLLRMGDFWTTYFEQYGWGAGGRYREDDHILAPGQEDPRTHEIGHTLSVGADGPVRYRSKYYLYDLLADRIHELNGLFGYAHQGMSFHGYRGMTLDVLRNKVDFLELIQFCVEEGPLAVDHYYHFLDLGYRLTATAGSDFPWCGKSRYLQEDPYWDAQIGNARFYTYVGNSFSFENWKSGLEAGHTFVTSGPMLELTVNGHIPGDSIDLKKGETLEITARAIGNAEEVPLQSLKIIAHGNILQEVKAGQPGQSRQELNLNLTLTPEHGLWIAARARADTLQVAHTTPVYITVNGDGFHNPETSGRYLDLSESYLKEIENTLEQPDHPGLDDHIWRHKEELEKRIAETREVIQRLRGELK